MLRKYPIKLRLLVSFILLSIIPVFLTGLLLYNRSSHAIHDKITYYSLEILNQVAQNVEQELQRLEYDSIEIMFSNDVQEVLSDFDKLSEWEIMTIEESLQNELVKQFSFLHDISDVLIYTNSGEKILAYGDQGSNILNYDPELLAIMVSQAEDLGGQPMWLSTNINDEVHKVDLLVNRDDLREGVVLVRAVRSLETNEVIGTMLMRTNEGYFSKIFNSMDLNKQRILIINQQGQIISTNVDEWTVGEVFEDEKLVQKITNPLDEEQGFSNLYMGNNLIFYTPAQGNDWFFVSFTPVSYLYEETHNILVYSLIVGLVAALIAVLAAIYISRSIFIPLDKIIENMMKVQNGDLSVRLKDEEKDELALVSGHFNKMIDEVEALIAETGYKEKEKRRAELQALQAQVNPHFLSNTLNSVKWLAHIQGADNIENLITSLIELLHEAMAKDTVFIQVKEEIKYLEHYLNIQAFRFYDKFRVHIDIEKSVDAYFIPKFLLQPIVENAIIHGFSKEKHQGTISIKVWSENNKLHFVVIDNGRGMSEGQIQHILNNKAPNKGGFNGIGIGNVIERIKMYYGDSGDFLMESSIGVFTRVEIICDILKEDELNERI